MADPFIPPDLLDFWLYDWLRPGTSPEQRETWGAVLELASKLASESFLPHNREADITEPFLDDEGVHILPAIGVALREYAELGMFAAGFPEELGGFGLPQMVTSAAFAQIAAASIATAAYPMLTIANARLIATFGTEAQVQQFALPLIEGRWFGTMCLSEPQAGSSLADIRTRAEPDGEDELGLRFRLTGNKMWISGGDQNVSENIVHLVLAKVPGADGRLVEGTKGISLLIVPKLLPDGARNDVVVAGLNHKLGYRGTANCLLNFGEGDGAIGWLVGDVGDGLKQMFQMMNEARIGVGIGAAALAYRGYAQSRAYASERLQGRRTGERGGDPVAIIEHPDVKRMLLAQRAYAEGALALCLYCAALVDGGDESAGGAELLGLLTPVAKTFSSEYGVAANDLAIQVLGGYGYTRDFDVEQLYRDNRLNPIHEGTTGIQANDLIARKLAHDSAGLAELERRIGATMAAAQEAGLTALAEQLGTVWHRLRHTIDLLGARDRVRALDNAVAFLSAFGHVVVAWLWLDQLVAGCRVLNDAIGQARRERAARFFFEYELPRVKAWLALVESATDVAAGAPLAEV